MIHSFNIRYLQDLMLVILESNLNLVFEQTGPFGAKSIGEIVINTPSPALAHAVYNATKVNIRTLPITSEKIVMGMIRK